MHETITFLLVTLPNIHRFKKNSLTDSAINLFNFRIMVMSLWPRFLALPVVKEDVKYH